MNITTLEIQNVKRLSAFGISSDDGAPIILTGDNAQGKSSVLDSILLALQNTGLEDPVRHGSNRASIKLTLAGESATYNVERVITKKGRTLKITAEDGTPIPSPQTFLDGLTGSLAFDPLEFVRTKPKQQAAMIRELSGLDTTAIDSDYKATFAQRTEINRQVAELKAQLAATPKPDVPAESDETEVSVSSLIQRRDEVSQKLVEAEKHEAKMQQIQLAVDSAEKRVEDAKAALEAAEAHLAKSLALRDELAAQSESITAEAKKLEAEHRSLSRQVEDADATNERVRLARSQRENAKRQLDAYHQKKASWEDAAKRSAEMTAKLDKLIEEKESLAKSAKMPVPGMSFDDDGVMIDNVRFDQLSTAEQVRVSTSVAMASNPKLRIILIREGALLNKANIKAICEAAQTGGYQIWMERFQENPGEFGLHIEDGAVTHINGKPIESVIEPDQSTAAADDELAL